LGEVVAIDGINIDGTEYVFDLVDGTYDAVFGGTVYSASFAADAATQIAAMFVGTAFENSPHDILGCGDQGTDCFIFLPFLAFSTSWSGDSAAIHETNSPTTSTWSGLSRSGSFTDAIWGVARAVPEPGTLGLLGAGLIGLAWRRRGQWKSE
jgi:hypothetical protein